MLGFRKSNFPDHSIGKQTLDGISTCTVGLQVDVMDFDRDAMQQKSEAAGNCPIERLALEGRAEGAQRRSVLRVHASTLPGQGRFSESPLQLVAICGY